jgi:hypothetical protein
MFIDCLGREPTADELKDIRLNVWMLERAGFAVEDPSNAPHIAPWAWIWARLPRREDAQAALAAAGREIAEHNQISAEALEALALEWLSKIDTEGVGAAIARFAANSWTLVRAIELAEQVLRQHVDPCSHNRRLR